MTTLDHRPPESAPPGPYSAHALRLMGTGLTAAGIRAHAGSDFYVERTARLAGNTPAEAREELLVIACAIEALENRGLTRGRAYFLAGLDKVYGPYPGPDSLNAA